MLEFWVFHFVKVRKFSPLVLVWFQINKNLWLIVFSHIVSYFTISDSSSSNFTIQDEDNLQPGNEVSFENAVLLQEMNSQIQMPFVTKLIFKNIYQLTNQAQYLEFVILLYLYDLLFWHFYHIIGERTLIVLNPFHPTGQFLAPKLINLINDCIFYTLSVDLIVLYEEQDANFMLQSCLGLANL